ncbi:unnamed protein product [Anisakis simplex]|uniref:Uncharacterized protein n=1 Tax=Anisakis simplex TaxID=6269 RepID=A0A0M3JJS3_ANISI|nr:unnamed protein product [Anisakis simplex]
MITAVSANSVPSFYRQSYYHANTTNSGSSHQRYNERSHHQHDLDAHSTASSDSENQSPCLMDGAFEGDLDSSGQSDLSFTGNSPRAPSSAANNSRVSSQIHDGGHGDDGYNRRHNAAANSATMYRTSTPLKQTKLTGEFLLLLQLDYSR